MSVRARTGRASSPHGFGVALGLVDADTALEIRLPVEDDRDRFVELFCDDEFMIFSAGVLDPAAAHRRFDEMLIRAEELAFAKQPLIERATGVIVGYSGVNWFEFEGERRLEYGYRLIREARGRGYATEESRALLTSATDAYEGEILAMVDPTNIARRRSPASSDSPSGCRR